MPNPESFIRHLREEGYHPRSDKHSNALSQAIVEDLIRHCPRIREKASRGELVYQLNVTIMAGTSEWNVDLVFGPPSLDSTPPRSDIAILRENPSTIEIAVEIKSVMTEAIAAAVLVINAAATFQSPLRTEVTVHRNPVRLVEHCISELRAVSTHGGTGGYGLEAKCAVIVSMDNINSPSAAFVTTAPAPAVGDPLHYDAFIRTICDHYGRRF